MKTRVMLFAAAALLLSASLLWAGGSQEKGAAAGGKPVQITLGYSGGVWIEKYFDQVLSQLPPSLNGITVKKVVYPTYDDLLNTLPSQVAAKTNPDVLYWTNEQLAEYVGNGVLANLNSLVSANRIDLGQFYSGLVSGWTMDGALYGVPFNGQDSALVVNLGLLKKAGIEAPPTSMAELRADALQIKQKTGDTGVVLLDNLFHISQYVYAFGGGWGYGKTIDTPQNAQGLQFLVDLFTKDKSAATAKQLGAAWDGEAFAKGTVGFSTGGPWYIGYMQQAGPKVDYTLLPIPTSAGGTTMVTYGGGLSVFKNAADKAAAGKLIAYLTDDANMKLMATSGLKYLPAKTSYMDLYIKMVPQFAPLKDAFFKGRGLDYPPNVTGFGDDLVKGFEQMIFQTSPLTPAELLSQLQSKYGSK